ncbi:MAG: hypothetical protein H6R10_2216 [Rhodocyclaceae bacterium]|nr:hypothetical protein [Rhodocyclaceae bacterium]
MNAPDYTKQQNSPDTRSPLRDKPLRNPGQSIREQRFDLFYDKLLAPMLVVLMFGWYAVMEWWRYFFPSSANPWFFTAIAVVGAIYAVFQARKVWPRIKAMKLAEEGEKAVGQFLERLRHEGYYVFHDIVGQDFNVDHVIIGPAGVFTVETKTWKKPKQGKPEIRVEGETLTAGGRTPDRSPVVQAKAQANWIKGLLSDSTGKKYPVRPVVLFPGWFIEADRESRKAVWVLEPKALPAFLAQEKELLPPEDIKLANFHLSRFVREQERIIEASK